MGTLYLKPETMHEDLKVTILDSGLIFPSQETTKRTMFLSNIDKVLNFDVQTVHFFPACPGFPPEIVAGKIKNALRRLLVTNTYDFLAGRLTKNKESERVEIECNAAGLGFAVASSEFALEDIGDLVYPNPAFRQLVTMSFDFVAKEDQPLCFVQVTAFKCGGFSLGTSMNHISFDGSGFKMFLENLAALAFNDDGPLAVVPCNDRSLLAARSPPQVTFPHPELLKVNLPAGEEMAPPVFDSLMEDLSFEIFQLSSADIDGLKDKAKAPDNVKTKVTGFNALTAAIWRCKALSCGGDNNSDRLSTVLFAVDIRRRLNPPLPDSYSGNAVLTGYATAKCAELEEGPFWKTVQMVYEGAVRMTDEYARSAIDWGELYKGFPHGEFLVSSWWRLGFEGVQFPWGKPKYSCPVVYHRKDIILLFPDIDNGENSNRGVNVLVALPPKEMEKFKSLFHKFLA
nr:omega-hydroxypalmitate O-feruloyl transferase [Ipomoea batatas]GMC77173.1 omega-hydroxypalmitate O-feruloyl transferase [Ipomoea batatas]